MTVHELHHPVDEESAREFVDNTAASDATDAEKEQQVQNLLQGAAANAAWRDSRDAEQRLALASEPFAVVDTDAESEDTDANS